MIARTAQLWTEVTSEEQATTDTRRHAVLRPPRLHFAANNLSVGASASVGDSAAVGHGDDAVASDAENSAEISEAEQCEPDVQEDTESDNSGDTAHSDGFVQRQARQSSPLPANTRDHGDFQLDDDSDSVDSSRSDTDMEDARTEGDFDDQEPGFQSADDDTVDISNRDINVSKAEAVRNGIMTSLNRLGFRPTLTNAALEAGILEIEHYDADCELAYVDIFLSLMKIVCDAHLDVLDGARGVNAATWAAITSSGQSAFGTGAPEMLEGEESSTRGSSLPFKWPVFDMAQFEFGNARAGTCFDSVCVLINLPKVSLDRSHELMELLSCNLFCMIGDPIQVVTPSVSSTGRTKGHAFLEFDDPAMARRCAAAVDGMTWGRGLYGRIRACMFRHYQVKPSVEGEHSQSRINRPASFPGAIDHERNRYVSDTQSDITTSAYFNGGLGFGGLHRGVIYDDVDQDGDMYGRDDEASEVDHRSQHLHQRAVSLPVGMTNLIIGDDGEILDTTAATRDGRMQQFPLREITEPRVIHGYELSFSSGEDSEYDDNSSLSGDSVLELQTDEQSMERTAYPAIDGGFEGDNEEDTDADDALSLRARLRSLRHIHERLQEEGVVSFDGTQGGGPAGHEGAYDEDYDPFGMQFVPRSLPDDSHDADYCDLQESDDADKPWRAYCSELIAQNREMQDQIAIARRRIVQLGHNNQKLHLLIDRVERDRDGLLFENDLLQSQLQGVEANERHHDSLLKELVLLRKRLKTSELIYPAGNEVAQHEHQRQHLVRFEREDSRRSVEPFGRRRASAALVGGNTSDLDAALSPSRLATASMDDLKEWERSLDTALARVRSVKEEKAAKLQKKLDRQVEEQQELKLCVICLSSEKSILCLPCRHLCLCGSCASRQEVDKCPICRLEIDEMIQVYA